MTLNLLTYYTSLISSGSTYSNLENQIDQYLDLSNQSINQRFDCLQNALRNLNIENLNKPGLEEEIKHIIEYSHRGFVAIQNGDENPLNDLNVQSALETIVQFDGSRPAFLIKNNIADLSSSPIGSWEESLTTSSSVINKMYKNIGRIGSNNNPDDFNGTGFMISQDLLVTNRHVLEIFGNYDNSTNSWNLKKDVHVDFGFEYQSASNNPVRRIKAVAFAPKDAINLKVDHLKADLAILELEPCDDEVYPFHLENPFPDDLTRIYSIGYSGDAPKAIRNYPLVKTLFQNLHGYKRIAPGLKIDVGDSLPDFSFAHDASTLLGNSGSVVLFVGLEEIAVGLHYGGKTSHLGGFNFTHKLSQINATDITSGQTLQNFFDQNIS